MVTHQTSTPDTQPKKTFVALFLSGFLSGIFNFLSVALLCMVI